MSDTFHPEPCAGCPVDEDGQHTYADASEPCQSFVSQGFGIRGDYEHSLYCVNCSFERGDHGTAVCTCGDGSGDCRSLGCDPSCPVCGEADPSADAAAYAAFLGSEG